MFVLDQIPIPLLAFAIVLKALAIFLLVSFCLKSCLEDEKCRSSVAAGQGVLEELQDSMSETERDKRLRALKDKEKNKNKGLSTGSKSLNRIDKGKNALGEKDGKGNLSRNKRPLYPTRELEALGLDDSESEELSPSEESDLEKEAALYEEEHYHPDERPLQILWGNRRPMLPPPTAPVLPTAPPP